MYTPVEQRKVSNTTPTSGGYIPVNQRQAVPTTSSYPNFNAPSISFTNGASNTTAMSTPAYIPVQDRSNSEQRIFSQENIKAKDALNAKSSVTDIMGRNESITSSPKTTLEQIQDSNIPKFMKDVITQLKEGVRGRGQEVDITGDLKTDTGFLGFFRPFGIGKTDLERVNERYDNLIEIGITPERATQISTQYIKGRGTDALENIKNTQNREDVIESLNLTKEEKRALLPVAFFESLDTAFGALDFVGIGSISKNTLKKVVATDTVEKGVIFLKRIGVNEQGIEQFAKEIPDIKNEKQAQEFFNKLSTFQKQQNSGYKETGDLTTTLLRDLEGKTTVSKQYILDATNRPELKQTEKDIIRQIVGSEGAIVNVKDFADKVKQELLPLKVNGSDTYTPEGEGKDAFQMVEEGNFTPKYENISLPDDVRGDVANYKENIYESPVGTTAGNVHFNYHTKNYFGHTRIEDMADDQTRRIIEVQSDLYQRGNLEKEFKNDIGTGANRAGAIAEAKKNPDSYPAKQLVREKEVSKLQQYSNPTAHFRMVREEIRKAAQDGKTKLQFPTGETAMKIEGLGDQNRWVVIGEKPNGDVSSAKLTPQDLKVGKEVAEEYGDEWIITDVLGDGKFKAVPVRELESIAEMSGQTMKQLLKQDINELKNYAVASQETFDISGKVDTNNPIYRFYEKDLGRYLSSKYQAKLVTDKQGVKWYEVGVKPEEGSKGVTAFKKPIFSKQSGPKADIETIKKLIFKDIPEKDVRLIFTDDLIDGNATGKYTSTRDVVKDVLKPMVELYEEGGKVEVRTAFHESYHYVFNNFFSPEERKMALNLAKKEISLLDKAEYKLAGYKGDNIILEEYLADTYAKQKASQAGFKGPLQTFLQRLDNVIKKIVETAKKVLNKIDELLPKQGRQGGSINLDFSGEPKKIMPIDRLIAEGKIKINRVGNRDVYSYKKGSQWQRARDEDSAIRAVTKGENPLLDQKKLELEIKKEMVANHPAQGLSKFVAKRGEFKGSLPEVTGKGGKFGTRGDSMVTESGFEDSEMARESYEDLKKRKEELASIKAEIKEISSASKTNPLARIPREEVQSLEDTALQALNKVDEPFRDKVVSFEKIISNHSTSVKEKVGFLDYFRTPDRVLTKIGLGDVAKELRKSYDAYTQELPKHIKTITDWSKEVPKESNTKIFKYLDGQTGITLTEKEGKVADEIRQYLEEWAVRLGLPEDNKISHYITHIFELGENQVEFDEEIAKIIKDKVAGSVYDPFLEKRLGKKGYVEDTWRALDAYVKRAVRKANMDPALKMMKEASNRLEDSGWEYVKRLGDRINMRPTEWDTLFDNNIKQLVGYRFGQRPTAVISGALRKMIYRGALGGNITSAVKNLTQGVNTFSKLGTRDTLTGYIKLMKPGMTAELEESGVLNGSFIEDRTLSAVKQTLQKVDKGLFIMFELAEKINRGSAYFGAKSKAIRQGMSEEEAIEYAKKLVRDTQFVFSSIDTPVAMQGDIAKTLFQFGSFSQKQIEFLTEMAKNKEWAGIIRYIVASMAIVYTVGEVFGIEGKDFNPLNYFSRFGKPPSLALPIEIIKAVINTPDQYGKVPSTDRKIKNIINSGTTLVPAGVQIKKLMNGNVLTNKKQKEPTGIDLPKLPKLPAMPKLPKIKSY